MVNIHTKLPDLNLIAVFDVLLKERNVTRAAAQLGVSQSAMSHSLARLRRWAGDPLFVRISDRMEPTPRADELSAAVHEAMAVLRAGLLPHARLDPATTIRRFTFCMTDMGELVFLPPLIEAFRRHAPHCTIQTLQLPQPQIPQALQRGEADLALGSLRSMPEDLFQQQLFTEPFVTLVSVKNKTVGARLSIKQFTAMKHVVVNLSGKDGDAYDRAIDDAGIHRKIFLTTPHFMVVPLILEQNPDMVATVPRELGVVFAKYKAVRVLPPPIAMPRFALRQYWHSRVHHDRANIWLRQLIKETFSNHPE